MVRYSHCLRKQQVTDAPHQSIYSLFCLLSFGVRWLEVAHIISCSEHLRQPQFLRQKGEYFPDRKELSLRWRRKAVTSRYMTNNNVCPRILLSNMYTSNVWAVFRPAASLWLRHRNAHSSWPAVRQLRGGALDHITQSFRREPRQAAHYYTTGDRNIDTSFCALHFQERAVKRLAVWSSVTAQTPWVTVRTSDELRHETRQ